MEAAAVACRGGLLAAARPGSRARPRVWGHAVVAGSAPATARRRLLVASPGVGEPLPARSLDDDAVAELEVDEDADPAQILPTSDVPPDKTLRVKFVLKKQCAFGQQFLVVGDVPALGLWDPAKAAALDWSEGHEWTVITDFPANKLVEFKFLLRDDSGHVRWQHGPNRTLQTSDTTNTLVVHEDWDHANNQKLSEEEVSVEAEDANLSDDFAASNGAVLAGELRTDENLETQKPAVAADVSLHGEILGSNEANQQKTILGEDPDIPAEQSGETSTVPENGNSPAGDDAGRKDDDTEQGGTGEMVVAGNGDPSVDDNAGRNGILENDLAWATKAMQQVLRTLGFQVGTTRT